MPSAALIEVLEWPTPKVSYSLSARLGKGARPSVLLDGVQLLAPAGEHLVRIGLVAHVPHQAVVRRVEDIMQGDGQLDRAQAGGEMAAAGADGLDQELAQLVRRAAAACRTARPRRSAGRFDRRRAAGTCRSAVIAAQVYTGSPRSAPTRRRSALLARLTTKSASCASAAARGRSGASARDGADRAAASRPLPRGRQAHGAGIGRLVARGVRAGRLAEQRRYRLRRRGCRPGSGRRGRSRRRSVCSASSSGPAVMPAASRAEQHAALGSARRSCAGACSRLRRRVSCWPTAARSIAWPPAMPRVPLRCASTDHLAAAPAPSGRAAARRRARRRRAPAAHRPPEWPWLHRRRGGRWGGRGAGRRRPWPAGHRAPGCRRGSVPRRRRRVQLRRAVRRAHSPVV